MPGGWLRELQQMMTVEQLFPPGEAIRERGGVSMVEAGDSPSCCSLQVRPTAAV